MIRERKTEYHLVLLDVHIPEMEEFAFMRKIQRQSDVPIIREFIQFLSKILIFLYFLIPFISHYWIIRDQNGINYKIGRT